MNKPTVLFIDDEPQALVAVGSGLEERGYHVLTADGGKEALEILKSKTPDIIIADLRMDPMNGFEVLREVKKFSKFRDTPFLFLTAINDPLALEYGQKLGVDAYVLKPVELDDLDSVIKNKLASR